MTLVRIEQEKRYIKMEYGNPKLQKMVPMNNWFIVIGQENGKAVLYIMRCPTLSHVESFKLVMNIVILPDKHRGNNVSLKTHILCGVLES